MSKDSDILEAKFELLKNEVWESKIYLEVCAITLFFILTTFLGTDYGLNQIQQGQPLGQIILITALILLLVTIYLFIRIIYLAKGKIKQTLNDKKMILQEWLH